MDADNWDTDELTLWLLNTEWMYDAALLRARNGLLAGGLKEAAKRLRSWAITNQVCAAVKVRASQVDWQEIAKTLLDL